VLTKSRSGARSATTALEALTGSKKMDASATLDYFALKASLDEQLKGKEVGWEGK
jgi:hypothetical protein